MLKFNNNNIFTGYLKQLLAYFNLPKYRVYTREQQKYHEWAVAQHNKSIPLEKDVLETISPKYNPAINPNNIRVALYLKDDKLQYYTTNSEGEKIWITSPFHYHENKKELNYTKNFQIKNNIYDTYTHEYLGDFLRFTRDHYNVNLMPLYNCFSNKLCNNLNLEITNTLTNSKIIFNSDDSNYKIYMLPVKLFKEYTIAIDCDSNVEFCCGFYDSYLDERQKLSKISRYTYQKVNSMSFKAPITYKKLLSDNLTLNDIELMELAQNEPDLKLFIKLPATNNSSITVLEGNYDGYNNSLFTKNKSWKTEYNHFVTNYASQSDTAAEITDNAYTACVTKIESSNEISNPFENNPEWKESKFKVYVTRNDGVISGLSSYIYQNVSDPTIYKAFVYGTKYHGESYYICLKDGENINTKSIAQNPNWKFYEKENYFKFVKKTDFAEQYIFSFNISWINPNYKHISFPEIEDRDFNPITELQLLKLNTETSYPFADRLIEYLVGNAITSQEDIYDNTKRIQTVLSYENFIPISFGAWENQIRNRIYDKMYTIKNRAETKQDILGYVDKDVEKYYSTYTNIEKTKSISFSNVDIYDLSNSYQ